MIRLALAVGFLAVFGLVAFSTIILLTHYVSKKNKENEKRNTNSNSNN
jgi:hypothetical protein